MTHDPAQGIDTAALARLEQALLSLAPFDRELFLAHRLDELSIAQIAARTGLSATQVGRALARAISGIDRHLCRAERRSR